MRLKLLWPGKTQNRDIRNLQDHYLARIKQFGKCELIETREAKGISEKYPDKIIEIEASGLEKHLKDDFIICLSDKGKIMNSEQFARYLNKISIIYPYSITFIAGGFLGLAERIINRADLLLSLSKMTFSHELTRIILLEQIYRSLSIIKGTQYAK
jgi:23S rRNA (pseudouridine1915-N3)-methyltransferase